MTRGIPKSGINRGWFRPGIPSPKGTKHRKAIARGVRQAWQTKRKRLPIGSKNRDANGYVRVKIVEGNGRWQLEHILVMEKHLERKLTKEECVHHINGDPGDNSIMNLFLCRNRAHHAEVERSLAVAFRRLLEVGKAKFDRWTGVYEAIL